MSKREEIEGYEALRNSPYSRHGANVEYCKAEKKVVEILNKGVAPELPKSDIYEINGEWRRVGINSNGGVYFEEMSFLNE